jgi:hypothetical protein
MADNVKTFRDSRYAKNQAVDNAKDFATIKNDTGMTWQEYSREMSAHNMQEDVGKGVGGRLINHFGAAVEYGTTLPPYLMGMTPDEAGLGGTQLSGKVIDRVKNPNQPAKQLPTPKPNPNPDGLIPLDSPTAQGMAVEHAWQLRLQSDKAEASGDTETVKLLREQIRQTN